MKVFAAVWLAIVTAMPASHNAASAANDGITVVRAGDPRISAHAGTVTTVAFRLRNPTSSRSSATITASVPLGWTLVSAASEVNLASGTSELQLLSFAIPRNARPGQYTVHYRAKDAAAPRNGDADSVVVMVGRKPALDVQFMAAPAIVRGGSTFTISFALRNQGNVPLTLGLRALAAGGLIARPDFTGALVEPDNTFYVTVRVTAPERVNNEIHTRVTLIATDRTENVEVSATSTVVRILPTIEDGSTSVGDLPLRLAARLNASERVTPSVELSGGGPLIAGTDLRVELMARTPSRSNGLAEDRDQFFLSVSDGNFDIRLGDHFVALTPLTELGRAEFGTTINVNAGPMILGALAARDRRGTAPDLQGGKLGFRVGSFGSVTGNYIAKSTNDAELLSVRALLTPGKFLQGDFEFAGNAKGTAASAHSVRLSGSVPRLSYEVRSLRNAADYRGSSAGISTDAAVVRLRPVRRFEVGAAVNRSERSDLVIAQSPRIESYRAFASFGRLFGIEGEQRDWILANGEIATRTGTLRARSSLTTGFVTWQPAVELIDLQNRNTNSSSMSAKYTLRTALKVARQSFALTVVRQASDNGAVGYASESATAAFRFFNSTQIDLDYQQDRYAGAWRTTLLNAVIDQRLMRDHHIAARARLVAFNNQLVRDQSVITLEYVLPLHVNMPRSRLVRLEGIVVDAHTNKPLRDVPVRLDDRSVVTGANGRFSFRDVEPQTHYLQVELAAVDRDLTTMTANPLIIDMSKAPVRELRIAVVPASRVQGTIRLSNSAARDDERLVAFLRNAIVELSQGSDVQRRSVNAAGQFGFEGLRPGTWQLRVINELPTDYAFAENTIRSVELAAGQHRQVVLEVIRRDRPMKLMEEKQLPTLRLEE